VAAFIGGEDTGLLERISGVDFYNTVSDMDGVNSLLYRKDAPGELDIYNFGRKCVGGITIFFQYLHNGRLPTYIVWCLLGMIGMSIVVYMR
jgi:hypothetical protein